MKFRDIPKLTDSGSYSVHIPWGDLLWRLEKDKEELGLEIDPYFQRPHVWDEKRQIAYIEYCLQGGKSGLDVYFNCKGWMGDFDGPYQLVDGKQRLHDVTRFMQNEVPAFGTFYKDFEDRLLNTGCYFNFHINDLDTQQKVLTWYIEMNQGHVAHTKDELNRIRKLLEALKNG